jgi:ribonuclease HI
MWNLVFESLLKQYEEGPVSVHGYADDASLIATGDHPWQMMIFMQNAANKALEWGKANGLEFSAEKTVSILFTNKRKYLKPPQLKLGNKFISLSNTVKYLGVTLDTKLSWGPHIKEKIRTAKLNMLRIKNAMGKIWGAPPRILRWAFTGIIRPALTYGSIVWAQAAQKQGIQKELSRVNRLALMTLGHFRKSTPTAGMEVINYIRPLHLQLKMEASMSFSRIKNTFIKGGLPPHLKFASSILGKSDISKMQMDEGIYSLNWNKNYHIVKESFKYGNPDSTCDTGIFTDGSLLNGKSGSGFLCEGRDGSFEGKFPLGENISVFQAEIYAIYKAAESLVKKRVSGQRLIFHVDNQAALLALDKNIIDKKCVRSAANMLNKLGKGNNVSLRWIKSHIGYTGNEIADKLAKEATTLENIMTDKPFIAKRILRNDIKNIIDAEWNSIWNALPSCRQTKLWFPNIDRKKSEKILKFSRGMHSSLIQMITGHSYLSRHEALMKGGDPSCKFCQTGEEQTAYHLIAQCPSFHTIRRSYFGHPDIDSSQMLTWSVSQLAGFLREALQAIGRRSDS